jgi:hypothetical protein
MDSQHRPVATDAELDHLQWVADPHGDAAIEAATCGTSAEERLRRIDTMNSVIREWQDNAAVVAWRPDARLAGTAIGDALLAYVSAAGPLPPWAEPARIARAERMFIDHGALSVTILFCASLPECYVVPDLAEVLHSTGQLDARAEHRIRTTGAMVFPVMMEGGLTQPHGSGVAQVLKVRLIHAMVRNLILRGSPEAAVANLRMKGDAVAACIGRLCDVQAGDSFSRALHVRGWNLAANALPNNQEELAYTLLTFSYVFLRSMRRLGIPFTRDEEEDCLHAWNVAGHYLGIRRELMADTMADAEALFARMQARGRADWPKPDGSADPRPRLAGALMDAMESAIPPGPFESFPVLLARRLLDKQSVRDLRLDEHVSWLARTLFATLMGTARGIDAAMRTLSPGFSIARLVTRAVGYRLTCVLLMSQTRELAVPERLRPGIQAVIGRWGRDPKAAGWMNALEDRVTTTGDWLALARPQVRARPISSAPSPAPSDSTERGDARRESR